ncbi:MAG: hypothetical protein ACOYKK_02895 [Microbacteriaceae bacterium]
MSDVVEDFDPLFYRPCIFPILSGYSYGTAITVNNGLRTGPHATDFQLSLSFFDNSGQHVVTTDVLHELAPGDIVKIDTRDVLKKLKITPRGNMLGIAHMVPKRFAGQELVSVTRGELMAHVSSSDDFIEFRQEPKGVITGVAYQMGPQNDDRFNKTRTTLLQAPKAIVTPTVDTLFALINASTSIQYEDVAHMEFWLVDPAGNKVARGDVTVPPWSCRFVSVRDLLVQNNLLDEFIAQGGLGMIVGLSRDSGLVPISMTMNLETGAIACDHTLPPVYYFTTWGGQRRIEANARLYDTFFADSDGPPLEEVLRVSA